MSPRLLAFLIHLGGSACLAAASLCVVYLIWYPAPLADAVGVSDIFLMLLGIDVVLGPVLTLVVYKRGKLTLVMDLAIIVLVQLAAFAYGVHAIAVGRPAWLVYSVGRFDLEQANDLDHIHVDEAMPAYRSVPWTGPKWVAARLPSDVKKRNELILGLTHGGSDLPQRSDLYVPIEQETQAMADHAVPIDKLLAYNPPEAVQQARTQYPQADAFMPLLTKGRPLTVLLKKGQAQPIAIVDLKAF